MQDAFESKPSRSSRFPPLLVQAGKWGVTLAVCAVILQTAAADYRKLRRSVERPFSIPDFFKVDTGQVAAKARIRTLNRMMPPFDDLADVVAQRKAAAAIDPEMFKWYRRYYQKVLEYMPALADAWQILGFSYYHLGEGEQAAASYEKASQLNPKIFWPFYNLGVLLLEHNRFNEAARTFQKAVSTQWADNAHFISSSRIYFPLINRFPKVEEAVVGKIKDSYAQGYLGLIHSCYHTRNFPAMLAAARTAIASGLDRQGEFYYYAGLAAHHAGQQEEALLFLQESVRKDPENVWAYRYWGLSLKALGKGEAAEEVLQRSKHLPEGEAGPLTPGGKIDLRIL